MMNAIAALLLFFWFLQNRQVISVDPYEGNNFRFQCIQCEPTTCTEKFMDAYPESEMGLTEQQMTNNKPDTYFYLFTQKNKDIAECMHLCPGIQLNNTRYNPKEKTVFIVHGNIQSACNAAWLREMKNEYLKRGNFNVFVVDWAWGNQQDYSSAMKAVRIVGIQIACLINEMKEKLGASPKNCHLLGHSLGAHVVGFAGKHVKCLGRITGLDPATTGYANAPETERLCPSDANYVDVIHTSAGDSCSFGIGILQPIGHADFYPNGGSVQLNCFLQCFNTFLKGDVVQAVLSLYPPVCFHVAAFYYFITSINPDGCCFIGYEADSYENYKKGETTGKWAVMGQDSKLQQYQTDGKPHKYYFDTSKKCPFCIKTDHNAEAMNQTEEIFTCSE